MSSRVPALSGCQASAFGWNGWIPSSPGLLLLLRGTRFLGDIRAGESWSRHRGKLIIEYNWYISIICIPHTRTTHTHKKKKHQKKQLMNKLMMMNLTTRRHLQIQHLFRTVEAPGSMIPTSFTTSSFSSSERSSSLKRLTATGVWMDWTKTLGTVKREIWAPEILGTWNMDVVGFDHFIITTIVPGRAPVGCLCSKNRFLAVVAICFILRTSSLRAGKVIRGLLPGRCRQCRVFLLVIEVRKKELGIIQNHGHKHQWQRQILG